MRDGTWPRASSSNPGHSAPPHQSRRQPETCTSYPSAPATGQLADRESLRHNRARRLGDSKLWRAEQGFRFGPVPGVGAIEQLTRGPRRPIQEKENGNRPPEAGLAQRGGS